MNMQTDPVDIDLAKHLDRIDEEDAQEEAVEALQKDILNNFYTQDTYSSLDEEFLQYFDEMGMIWDIVELVGHWRNNRMQECQDGFEKVCRDVDEYVCEKSWDYAVEHVGEEEI